MSSRHREKGAGNGPQKMTGEVPKKSGRPGCTESVVLGAEFGFYAKSNGMVALPGSSVG